MTTSIRYITYKFPTQYLSRIALKLSFLMDNLSTAATEQHPAIHQYGLENCLELCKIIEKPELKSRFLKEFLRIQHNFLKSEVMLPKQLSDALSRQIQFLDSKAGNFAEQMTEDRLIQQLRLTQGNSAELDYYSPALYLWRHMDVEQRQRTFQNWMSLLADLQQTTTTYLSLLEETILLESVELKQGFYQQSLTAGSGCPLILVRLEQHSDFIPKVQYSQSRISLSLESSSLQPESSTKPETVELGISQL
ncbi:MAG: cell division protein ZapD [Legionellaceae bacterium]|nr:cell division protein ZapD [Legionellaceae bacterium]